MIPTEVYPVGLLRDWQHYGWRDGSRRSWRYIKRRARAHDWRSVRNRLNGYLAEHDGCPHNCGRGWTERAALRRVTRICAAATDTETA